MFDDKSEEEESLFFSEVKFASERVLRFRTGELKGKIDVTRIQRNERMCSIF